MDSHVFIQRMNRRAFASLVVHCFVFLACYWLAYLLRFDFKIEEAEWPLFWFMLPAAMTIKLVIFYSAGHCHRTWHYVSLSDLAAIIKSASLSTLIIFGINAFVSSGWHIPRIVLALDWGLTIFVLGGARAALRLSREEFRLRWQRNGYRKALVIGANQSGETLARYLQADHRLKFVVTGFLDPDAARRGSMVGGIPVLGVPDQAIRYAQALAVEHLLVISGTLAGPQLRSLMEQSQQAGLTIKVIPALDDLLTSSYSVQMRDVDINDLLRREPVELSSEAIGTLIADRAIMVTGAGGSIGSEICRQVLKFRPRTLLLVEQAENSLFAIEQEFRAVVPEIDVQACIGDITDRTRMSQIFAQHRPHVVFHAAAHKHVPMMEYNPGEAIKNNVLGTQVLAELAEQFGVHEFVMISTDKAVNPTSVMGASKQLAERFMHAFSEEATTKFVAVRFGNVLASNGSVVPIFQEQIRRGGPVTVTHPDIERFFMTIPEASQLVLQAAAMGNGGEIFVLDMGQPVRIIDLARDLIRLSGLQPDDVEIVFTGLRPGEKLYEELYFQDEEMQPTPHPKLFVAYHRPYGLEEVRRSIDELSSAIHSPPDVLRRAIKELVPEYDSPETVPTDSPVPERDLRLPQRHTNPLPAAVPK